MHFQTIFHSSFLEHRSLWVKLLDLCSWMCEQRMPAKKSSLIIWNKHSGKYYLVLIFLGCVFSIVCMYIHALTGKHFFQCCFYPRQMFLVTTTLNRAGVEPTRLGNVLVLDIPTIIKSIGAHFLWNHMTPRPNDWEIAVCCAIPTEMTRVVFFCLKLIVPIQLDIFFTKCTVLGGSAIRA